MSTQNAITTSDTIFNTIRTQANAANPNFLSDVVYLINLNPQLVQQVLTADADGKTINFATLTNSGGEAPPNSSLITIGIPSTFNYNDLSTIINSAGPVDPTSGNPTTESITPAGYVVGVLSHEIVHANDPELAALYQSPMGYGYTGDQGAAIEIASEGMAGYNNAVTLINTQSSNAPLPQTLLNNNIYFTAGHGWQANSQIITNVQAIIASDGGNGLSSQALSDGSSYMAQQFALAPYITSSGQSTYLVNFYNYFSGLYATPLNINPSDITDFEPKIVYPTNSSLGGLGTLTSYYFETPTLSYQANYTGPNLYPDYKLYNTVTGSLIGDYLPLLGGQGLLTNASTLQVITTPVTLASGTFANNNTWQVNLNPGDDTATLSAAGQQLVIPNFNINSIQYTGNTVTAASATPTSAGVQTETVAEDGTITTDQLNQNQLNQINSQVIITTLGETTLTSNDVTIVMPLAPNLPTLTVGAYPETWDFYDPIPQADWSASGIGSALGSAIGGAIGQNGLGKALLSPLFGTVAGDFAGAAHAAFTATGDFDLAGDLSAGFAKFFPNLEVSGITSLADLGVGELVQLAGISGPGGQLVDQLAGSVISTVVTNAFENSSNIFANLGANLETAALDWAADELASLVIQPSRPDGSIGASIGSSLGGFVLGPLGAFLGDIIGTLVGDLFGEPASPQAWVTISSSTGTDDPFTSAFLKSKDDGPVTEVMGIGNTIATELNDIVKATGGVVATSSRLPAFNFGVRQGVAEVDGFGASIKFNDVQSAITYAFYKEIAGLQITGGDLYKVRALEDASTSISMTTLSSGLVQVNSSITTITGDLAIAADYENYLADTAVVDGIIAAAPNSAIAAGWEATLAAAASLGLDKRGAADWSAGWEGFLQANGVTAAQVSFIFDGKERVINAGSTPVDDTIDSIDKTIIEGDNSTGQTITVADNAVGLPNAGSTLTVNGTIVTAPVTIPIAAMIYGGSGAGDVIWAGNQGNDVFGGNGGTAAAPDVIYGYSSPTDTKADATWIFGGSGSNQITAGVSSGDYLDGGSGNDTINASLTNSAWIDGGIGNNTLIGGTGDDVITAEGSSSSSAYYSNTMIGGGGTDTYIINPYTSDTISNAPGTYEAPGGGTIELNGDIAFSQVGLSTVTTNGMTNLVIDVYGASSTGSTAGNYTDINLSNSVLETITVQNWSALADRVQYLETYDPQTQSFQSIDIGNFSNIQVRTGGNYFLEGSQASDALYGISGIDTIEGFSGGDLINGDGFLDGGTGSDTIFGGSQADTILGGPGSNVLEGGAGNDLILGAAFDTVASDSNTIQGGPGNDTVIGGPDHNLFEYAAGDGSDLLVSSLSTSAWQLVYQTASAAHADGGTQGFQSGFYRDGASGDITLTAINGGFAIGTPIYNTSTNTMNGIVDVEDAISSTGTSFSKIYWQPNLTQTANTLHDTLQFGPSITPSELLFEEPAGTTNLLIGIDDGNTNPNAPAGTFGALADQIEVENYFSTGAIQALDFVPLTGSTSSTSTTTVLSLSSTGTNGYILVGPTAASGNGTVSAPSNATSLQSYWLTGGYGSNFIVGGPGNDILTAGPTGVDTLDGGAGADTLIGNGQTFASYQDDTVGITATLANQPATLTFQSAAASRMASERAALAEMRLSFGPAYGMRSVFDPAFWSDRIINRVSAAGYGVKAASTTTSYTNTGYAAGDVYSGITGLIGTPFNDTLVSATYGDTQASASQTTSTLDGGGGNDLLIGGTGGDDFIYSVATGGRSLYGADTIELTGGHDTLEIDDLGGIGVTFDDLAFSVSNGNTLVIADTMSGTTMLAGHTITVIGLTTNGETFTLNLDGDTSVTFSGIPLSGDSGFAVASSAGGRVQGGASPTMIVGGSGNNVLIGESGNDTFEGGLGADTITGTSNASGTTTNTASYAGSSAGVTITLNNGAATGIGGDAQGDVLTNIQNLVGSAGNDSLSALGTNSEIDGGTGNDTIYGSGGNDTLIGNGVDSITSGTGNMLISVANCTLTGTGSTLLGGAGNDTIYGGAGNDYITSTAGFASSLNGGLGNDTLIGNGNDTLDGGGGTDLLDAGTGNVLLEDSNSNATLNGGSGQDTLFGGAGNNVLNAAATANTVLISDEGSLGGTLMTGTVNAADTNTLNGSTMAGIGAGNDTFEFSATSGITIVQAENGVNELQFDSSVNYQDLWFKGASPVLDIFIVGDSQPFEVEIPNFFFPGNNYAPSIADIVAGGKVLFLSQFNGTATPTQSLMYEQANLWGSSGAPSSVPGALTNLLNEGYYWQPIATATDTLSGTGGPTLLEGTKYNNVISGEDTVAGTSDTIIAGGETNLITESGNTGASIVGGSDSDTLIGGPGSNTILGGSGTESITGGASADLITAGSGAETINGLDGNDTITGGNGNYWIAGGGGSDLINVGSGNDTIYGYEPSSALGSGSDTDGANTIIAGGGNDLIYAGQDATLSGGDSIQIGASATPGNATIYGGTGWDTINLNGASAASDNLVFATGKDIIYQGTASDTIAGDGTDTVWFDSVSSGVTINMLTGVFAGGATGDLLSGIDNIWGSGYSDSIQANNDAEFSIRGAGGDDTLVAGSGNDVLQDTGNATMIGGAGNDSFIVYGGTDLITGGSGDDDFFLYGALAGTVSQGTRTVNGKQDVIDLEVGATGTLTVNGPGIMPPATEVSTEIAYLDNTPYYDLWFGRAQGSNNLTITELNSTGTQTLLDLVGWFTNPAIQDALNLQFFDAGTPTPGLNSPTGNVMLTTSSTGGLNITALLQLEATVAAPTTSLQATTLYTGAYKTALDLDWELNTPPTIAIQGSNTGTVLENINSGTATSTLKFTVSVGDSQTVAQNLVISASGGTLAAASWTQPNSSGLATITVTSSQFTYGDIPINVKVTDGDGATASTTYTLDVLAVDPPPVFVNGGVTGVSFNEGPTVTTKGTLSPSVAFYVDDLTPSGADDAGSVVVTASSSNQALISNADIGISTVSGYPTERVLTMHSEANQSGSSWITLTANDGGVSTTETFLATVNKVEIAPVISSVGTQTYDESWSSQTETIAFSVTGANGITPSVSDAVGANSSWIQTDGIINYGNGNYGAVITVDAGSWTTGKPGVPGGWTGSVVITASDGTDAPTEVIPISSVYEHLPFSVPASQTFTVAENSGVSVLTGFGSIGPIGASNGDTFTYTIVNGNTDGGAIGVASNTGLVYDNGVSWSPSSSNSYTFGVQVSNGVYSYIDNVTVNVRDNSPPSAPVLGEWIIYVNSSQPTTPGSGSSSSSPQTTGYPEVLGYTLSSTDPHGLAITYSLSVVSLSGMKYSLYGGGDILASNPGTLRSANDTLTITATDTAGLSATTVFVNDPYNGWFAGPNATASDIAAHAHMLSSIASFGSPASTTPQSQLLDGFNSAFLSAGSLAAPAHVIH